MEQIEQQVLPQIVQIVNIKELVTIYKNGESALNIELARCIEHGFEIIVQKNLYIVGDKAVYFQPDYCLPLLDERMTDAQKLFLSFTEPDGDVKKSKLGKNGRIRAIKFNFSLTPDKEDKIFSVGMLLPYNKVETFVSQASTEMTLADIFEITKYEEPESAYSGLSKGGLPSGMYKTDEENFKNRINTVNNLLPNVLIGTVKVDGSSLTIYYKNEAEFGICSRSLEKKLDQVLTTSYTNEAGNNIRKHYSQELKKTIWLNVTTNETFDTPDSSWIEITKEVDDTFVKLGTPVLEKIKTYCTDNNLALSFRFEMVGNGLKGSGNKNNPHAKGEQRILCYGVDDYTSGVTVKLPYEQYVKICTDLDINRVEEVFNQQFNSIEEITACCENYFTSNLIEGIVIRNTDSTFSTKFMNNEYDAKK